MQYMDDATASPQEDPAELAAYPRPDRGVTVADRLDLLSSSYYDMSFTDIVVFVVAACITVISGLSVVGIVHDDLVWIATLCALPVFSVCLSFIPMRRLSQGAGWRPWTGIALTLAIPAYMFAVFFLWPGIPTDQPQTVVFINDVSPVITCLLVFPVIRILIITQLLRTGLPLRCLFRGRKSVQEEIERLRAENLRIESLTVSQSLIELSALPAGPQVEQSAVINVSNSAL